VTVTYLSLPAQPSLTTEVRAQQEIVVAGAAQVDLLALMVREATEAVVQRYGAELRRSQVTETFQGDGGKVISLGVRPLASFDAARLDGTAVADTSDIRILDAERGLLIRDGGWTTGEKIDSWAVDYTGGWLSRADDLDDSTVLSASDTDDSFNLSSGSFPLLAVGEWFDVSGFSTSANNGTFQVLTRAAQKITVSDTLVTEAAGTVDFVVRRHRLPEVFERGLVELVKAAWYAQEQVEKVWGAYFAPLLEEARGAANIHFRSR
jgi:hypothetical protein